MGNWVYGTGPEAVYDLPVQALDDYVQSSLRPPEDCQKQIDEAVDSICAALQEATEPPVVTDVAKGGSYGRKTSLRGDAEGTLVIFIGDLENFQDQKEKHHEILSKIWQRLGACGLERKLAARMETLRPGGGGSGGGGGLAVRLRTKRQCLTLDVLPAFDALDLRGKPSPTTYRDLKRALDKARASPREFSVCFTRLQQSFF